MMRTNLKSPIVATYTAKDLLSKVKTVQVTHVGGTLLTDGPIGIIREGDGDDKEGLWTITIPVSTFEGLHLISGDTSVVRVTATDYANNESTATFSLLVDTENPTVEITIPSDKSVVNKEITIKGTASDKQLLAKVDVFIEDQGTGTFPVVPNYTFTGGSAYNWDFNFNTETWHATGAAYVGPVKIRAVATDEAGDRKSVV